MNATASTTIVVDVEKAARKVLKDPKGLSGVAATDLVALAQFALLDDEPRLSASLAAAIAAVVERRRELALSFECYATGPRNAALFGALNALQTTFEQEFPK